MIDVNSAYPFSTDIAHELGSTLLNFKADEHKNQRLQMAEKIIKRMYNLELQYPGDLFHDLIFIMTESQQWQELSKLLRAQSGFRTCKPNQKTIKYLRQNLVYCFQTQTRMDLTDAIDQFDQRFFSYQAKRQQEEFEKD